jgi:hypothetical protein
LGAHRRSPKKVLGNSPVKLANWVDGHRWPEELPVQGCTALPFDAPRLRALLIGSAEIGETIMRAFILRRVGPL